MYHVKKTPNFLHENLHHVKKMANSLHEKVGDGLLPVFRRGGKKVKTLLRSE